MGRSVLSESLFTLYSVTVKNAHLIMRKLYKTGEEDYLNMSSALSESLFIYLFVLFVLFICFTIFS